jgi:hypothetical protein
MESNNTEASTSEAKVQPTLWNTASEQNNNNISKRSLWVEVILKFNLLF